MEMNIIEKSLIGKKSQKACEDGIVVTEDFIAVIDGSTSKTLKQVCAGISNGKLAMQLIADVIRQTDANCSLDEFCKSVTEKFQQVCVEYNYPLPTQLLPHERMAASVALYSRQRHEIWMIGDCLVMADNKEYENNKPAEAQNAEKRSLFIKEAMQNGAQTQDFQTEDAGRAFIIDDIIASMQGQNKDYSVVDGTPIARDKIACIKLTANTSHEIVLATDGYPFLCKTLEGSERRLQRQLQEDPLCINTFKATKGLMKGYKSFDDRAYIRFCTK